MKPKEAKPEELAGLEENEPIVVRQPKGYFFVGNYRLCEHWRDIPNPKSPIYYYVDCVLSQYQPQEPLGLDRIKQYFESFGLRANCSPERFSTASSVDIECAACSLPVGRINLAETAQMSLLLDQYRAQVAQTTDYEGIRTAAKLFHPIPGFVDAMIARGAGMLKSLSDLDDVGRRITPLPGAQGI